MARCNSRCSRMTDRIRIETPTTSNGSAGEATYTYSTYATRYAHVRMMRGSETLQGGEPAGLATYRVEMRRDTQTESINHDARLVWLTASDKVLNLVSPPMIKDRSTIVLNATELEVELA